MIVPRTFYSFLGLGLLQEGLQSIRIRQLTQMVDTDTQAVIMSQESDTMAIPADDPQLQQVLGQVLTGALSEVLTLQAQLKAALQEAQQARQALTDYQATHPDQVQP